MIKVKDPEPIDTSMMKAMGMNNSSYNGNRAKFVELLNKYIQKNIDNKNITEFIADRVSDMLEHELTVGFPTDFSGDVSQLGTLAGHIVQCAIFEWRSNCEKSRLFRIVWSNPSSEVLNAIKPISL